PGTYIITRFVTFAVNNAYNSGADPIEQLLGYTSAINKEISRKRAEFGFETLAIGQTLAGKRFNEALELIDELSDADKDKYRDLVYEAIKLAKADVKDEAAITAAAEALVSANAELFKGIAEKLNDAVYWHSTYEN
ncbi:MAG: hypothetical protein IKZ03_04695, partial [Clostridia bacterium]|nr:hypothetical protein [Clostridia bacterium]